MSQSIDVHAADPLSAIFEPEGLRARVHKETVCLDISLEELSLSHHVVPLIWFLVLLILQLWVGILELVQCRWQDDLWSALVALRSLLPGAHTHRAENLLTRLPLGSLGLSKSCLATLDCEVLLYQCQHLRVNLRQQVPPSAWALDQRLPFFLGQGSNVRHGQKRHLGELHE